MTEKDWAGFTSWFELLDYLCAERGYFDNLNLANRLCVENGNHSQDAFNAAAKNLRNWRRGVHIPQRRNFVLLSKILGVDELEGLRLHWNRLYRQARDGTNNAVPNSVTTLDRKPKKFWPALVAVATAVGLLSVVGALIVLRPLATAGTDQGFDGIDAGYRRSVTLFVGDAVVIHGARGNECGPAPSWETVRPQLPKLATGQLTDGGIGTRYSRQCGGRVPARAILYTATTRGIEQTSLYGDPIMLTVQ